MINIKHAVCRMLQNAVFIGATQILSFEEINSYHFDQLLLSNPTYNRAKSSFCDLTSIPENELLKSIKKLTPLLASGSSLVFRINYHYSELEQTLSQLDLLIYEHIPNLDLYLVVKRPF